MRSTVLSILAESFMNNIYSYSTEYTLRADDIRKIF